MSLALSTQVLPASLCVALAALACLLYKNRRRRPGPLLEGGKIRKILIYPVKSLPPIEVDSADIRIQGVAHKTLKDR